MAILIIFFKLITVPLFIALITLVGRKWGPGRAGLLAGFPVVAGPIVIFIALEQGPEFAQNTALSAIRGTVALAAFTAAYCRASLDLKLVATIVVASSAWLIAALAINYFAPALGLSIILSFTALTGAGLLIKSAPALPPKQAKFNDLPWRMLTGALITLGITAVASQLGPHWSGTLATFPIISLVLAVFVHRSDGPEYVIAMYRGMLGGFYSFVIFFSSLAFLWPQANISTACFIAILSSFLSQLVVRYFLSKK